MKEGSAVWAAKLQLVFGYALFMCEVSVEKALVAVHANHCSCSQESPLSPAPLLTHLAFTSTLVCLRLHVNVLFLNPPLKCGKTCRTFVLISSLFCAPEQKLARGRNDWQQSFCCCLLLKINLGMVLWMPWRASIFFWCHERLWGGDRRSHFFRLRSCFQISESGSGSENFKQMRIRLLFRLRLQSMQTKITNGFNLRNDHADFCCCRNWNVAPDPGPVSKKKLTPGPKEKHRIRPESTPALGVRGHLCSEEQTFEFNSLPFCWNKLFRWAEQESRTQSHQR